MYHYQKWPQTHLLFDGLTLAVPYEESLSATVGTDKCASSSFPLSSPLQKDPSRQRRTPGSPGQLHFLHHASK